MLAPSLRWRGAVTCIRCWPAGLQVGTLADRPGTGAAAAAALARWQRQVQPPACPPKELAGRVIKQGAAPAASPPASSSPAMLPAVLGPRPGVRLCSRSRAAGSQLQTRCTTRSLDVAVQQALPLLCCLAGGAAAAAAQAKHLAQQTNMAPRFRRWQRHNAAQRRCRKQRLAAQGDPAQGLQAGGASVTALMLPRRAMPAQHSSAAQHLQDRSAAGQQGVDPHSRKALHAAGGEARGQAPPSPESGAASAPGYHCAQPAAALSLCAQAGPNCSSSHGGPAPACSTPAAAMLSSCTGVVQERSTQ